MLYIFVAEKTMGSKLLMKDFEMRIADGEKIGFVGRNGVGKTTLFRVIMGDDRDFDGKIDGPKNSVVMCTSQEHNEKPEVTTLDYMTSRLPEYSSLWHIIETYPETMGTSNHKMNVYSDALTKFSEKGYYDIQNEIEGLLDAYQLSHELLQQSFMSLSGGQKRLIELIAIQLAEPNIALLDEPTNHMDYVAKNAFISWLKATKCTCVVISHDRDVLQAVTRIVELKDLAAHSFPGNYSAYLTQNTNHTINQMHGFEVMEKRIVNLRDQIKNADIKARSTATAGRSGKNTWVTLRERLQRELDQIQDNYVKPSFWIDQESKDALAPKVSGSYQKYKAKNITLHKTASADVDQLLMEIDGVSLGYDNKPLFDSVSFKLRSTDRIHIIGRNGAGKSTLVKAIVSAHAGKRPDTLIGRGVIQSYPGVRLSVYEQEINVKYLDSTLEQAVEGIYEEKGLPINPEQVLRDLGNYLFDPRVDAKLKVSSLSGGQKARLQLIRLLVGGPNLLILDEPTNHLDLPSIEELENALKAFQGAIIYISHDNYFAKNIGGTELRIGA